jgi:uncharacterized membrane protein
MGSVIHRTSTRQFIFLTATLFASPVLFAQGYTFDRFRVPGASGTYAASINNRGAIVGTYFSISGSFKRDASGVLEFPVEVPGGVETDVSGINQWGEIVGTYRAKDGSVHGFLLMGGIHGTVTTIDVPPGPATLILGINNLGDFCGSVGVGLRQEQAFVSIGGTITKFDFPGALSTRATAIAWDGTVVGFYYKDISAAPHGFLRGPKGNFMAFDAGGSETYPMGISNEAGMIAGTYFDGTIGGGDRNHGFVYNYVADLQSTSGAGTAAVRTVPVQIIDYPDTRNTFVTGINSSGVLVGWSYHFTGPVFSFIATPGQ